MLFDAEVLRQFESARLLARRAARGRTAAERRSLHRGSGMEFSEYRAFVPGDDFRRIDWHAYARWRELFVRLLVEEQDWPVHFLLDCSNSMRVGRPPKFDHARRVLGGLAYIALGILHYLFEKYSVVLAESAPLFDQPLDLHYAGQALHLETTHQSHHHAFLLFSVYHERFSGAIR